MEYFFILLGYLLGSIPFGLILTRLAGLGDIRNMGSGNIGATNVLRTGNKKLALLTLLLDGGKGGVAVLIAQQFSYSNIAIMTGLFSIIGHMFPLWLKFKGGKGVATTLGVALALTLPTGIISCVIWVITALIFRISSLSALIAVAFLPLLSMFFYLNDTLLIASYLITTCLIFLKHSSNIRRMIAGKEPRIGYKSKE